jgi:hypothetical protein
MVNSRDKVLLLVGIEFQDDEGNRATIRTVCETVEVWRGDRLRHRLDRQLVLEPGRPQHEAFEINRGPGPHSTRLICRLLIDGTEVARLSCLEARLEVDAQGRFEAAQGLRVSEATAVAYRNEFARLLRAPSGNGGTTT